MEKIPFLRALICKTNSTFVVPDLAACENDKVASSFFLSWICKSFLYLCKNDVLLFLFTCCVCLFLEFVRPINSHLLWWKYFFPLRFVVFANFLPNLVVSVSNKVKNQILPYNIDYAITVYVTISFYSGLYPSTDTPLIVWYLEYV